ncbi:MAG TPA: hypothetical protein VKT12_00730 [Candidatus Binataceae bacterium]|nr:hypothetical protein [Candidatus Binataceae bacterium]
MTALLFFACATAKAPEADRSPAAQNASRPAGHIYVTGESLDTACYREVGEVSCVEPFATAATDPDNLGMADELRKAAVEKYPNRVDAIINVHTADRDIGSEVLVTGEAVQLEPPSKIDCKLPDTIAAVLLNFATGSKGPGIPRGESGGAGYSGPAAPANTAADPDASAGTDSTRDMTEGLRGAMVATMPQTRVNSQSLADQAELQQAEIKRLRKKLDQMVGRRCEAADVSAAECASMRKAAELPQPHEVVAVANKEAGDSSPSAFEIQNLIQAQGELIAKLRRQIADMNDTFHVATGAAPSH